MRLIESQLALGFGSFLYDSSGQQRLLWSSQLQFYCNSSSNEAESWAMKINKEPPLWALTSCFFFLI